MKITICIPIYNFDSRPLIQSLIAQIKTNHLPIEIVIIDDASNIEYQELNLTIKDEVTQYISLEKNIGRANIRNLFLKYTNTEFLLFLDCDGQIISSSFLPNYCKWVINHPKTDVLYGGRTVAKQTPKKEYHLRWKFANERENLSCEKRLQIPYLSFQTNNFLVKKEVLSQIPFDSEYSKYGYEDLLFAMNLKAKNIKIEHFNNPIFNKDLETNVQYLQKVDESIISLSNMLKNKKLKHKLSEVKLVKAYNTLNNYPTRFLIKIYFSLFEKKLSTKLLEGNHSLKYLDAYKLGKLFKEMDSYSFTETK